MKLVKILVHSVDTETTANISGLKYRTDYEYNYITQYCASALVSLMDWEHFWENILSKKSHVVPIINPHVGYYLVVLQSVVKAELDTSGVQY